MQPPQRRSRPRAEELDAQGLSDLYDRVAGYAEVATGFRADSKFSDGHPHAAQLLAQKNELGDARAQDARKALSAQAFPGPNRFERWEESMEKKHGRWFTWPTAPLRWLARGAYSTVQALRTPPGSAATAAAGSVAVAAAGFGAGAATGVAAPIIAPFVSYGINQWREKQAWGALANLNSVQSADNIAKNPGAIEMFALPPGELLQFEERLEKLFKHASDAANARPPRSDGDMEVLMDEDDMALDDLAGDQRRQAEEQFDAMNLDDVRQAIVQRIDQMNALRAHAMAYDENPGPNGAPSPAEQVEDAVEGLKEEIRDLLDAAELRAGTTEIQDVRAFVERNIIGTPASADGSQPEQPSSWDRRIQQFKDVRQEYQDKDAQVKQAGAAATDAQRKELDVLKTKLESIASDALVARKLWALGPLHGMDTRGEILDHAIGGDRDVNQLVSREFEGKGWKSTLEFSKDDKGNMTFTLDIQDESWFSSDTAGLQEHVERMITLAINEARAECAKRGEVFDMAKMSFKINGYDQQARNKVATAISFLAPGAKIEGGTVDKDIRNGLIEKSNNQQLEGAQQNLDQLKKAPEEFRLRDQQLGLPSEQAARVYQLSPGERQLMGELYKALTAEPPDMTKANALIRQIDTSDRAINLREVLEAMPDFDLRNPKAATEALLKVNAAFGAYQDVTAKVAEVEQALQNAQTLIDRCKGQPCRAALMHGLQDSFQAARSAYTGLMPRQEFDGKGLERVREIGLPKPTGNPAAAPVPAQPPQQQQQQQQQGQGVPAPRR